MPSHYFMNKLKEIPILSSILTEKSLKQLRKYIITGLLAYIIEYSTYYLLLTTLSMFIANSVGMFVGFWISFLLNRLWSFQSKDKFLNQLYRYSFLFLINLILSNLLLKVFSEMLNIHAKIAKLIIMCMVVSWNFFIFQKIIYKDVSLKK